MLIVIGCAVSKSIWFEGNTFIQSSILYAVWLQLVMWEFVLISGFHRHVRLLRHLECVMLRLIRPAHQLVHNLSVLKNIPGYHLSYPLLRVMLQIYKIADVKGILYVSCWHNAKIQQTHALK